MKFSEMKQESWKELRPYLDTCLLPVTWLNGREEPWEAAGKLEELRDLLDLVEIPFKGRVVTYPAVHYIGSQETAGVYLDAICLTIKEAGFRYVIAAHRCDGEQIPELRHADLQIRKPRNAGEYKEYKPIVEIQVRELWQSQNDSRIT